MEDNYKDYMIGSIIRDNLINQKGYSPYCGNMDDSDCSNPRTHFNGQQFVCMECSWVSQFPKDFINIYKSKWNIV